MSIILPNLNHSFISPVPVPFPFPIPVPDPDFRVFHTPKNFINFRGNIKLNKSF